MMTKTDKAKFDRLMRVGNALCKAANTVEKYEREHLVKAIKNWKKAEKAMQG